MTSHIDITTIQQVMDSKTSVTAHMRNELYSKSKFKKPQIHTNNAQQTEYSTDNPLNREPPLKKLISSFLTPPDISYDRNHGPIPHLSAESHTVRVDGLVSHPLTLSIQQLRTEFPQHEVTCALECAGNRRHTMRTMLKEVQGIDWGDAAVMNCAWKGPRVRDVLRRAGVSDRVLDPDPDISLGLGLHVAFSCYQVPCQDDGWFGSSVPLERCWDVENDAVLALEMNGSTLSPNHGYPVRVVLPGIAGARWVKWLDHITVQDHETSNFYQQHDYKILPPEAVDAVSAEPFWAVTPAMCDMPINSVVAVPDDHETVRLLGSGELEVVLGAMES
ncbi:hypothetical protein EYZ11_011819 [Aspergillus tanneri]|uniref:Oxidoreductase molybdopterin-binding domain-containing protein n=1 Tax=Aspergillus tanneri TaxID=1220188 RepID=A0A4S3J760_9EURO|nr:hypothetical protein EYZ11_011819 [Aspergillus tanneri]